MKPQRIIDLVIFGFIFLFLLSFFEPKYLFSLTTTTGGDTVSHFPTLFFMKEVLFPHGQIMGWEMGNYAGFPMFYYYFPITFVIGALLSFIIPLQIAFKLITILGTFLLPVCAYWMLRCLRCKFPLPIIAAIFTLPFLFMQANSMWGGNIPSTLAGEYSYSFGLALLVLFFGTIYQGIEEKKHIIANALLVMLIGFSHGYALILSGVIASFFLFTRRDFWRNLFYLVRVFGLAFLLLAFWLIPFYANTPYVTSYVTRWGISSILEVTPLILIPFMLAGLAALFWQRTDRRIHYFLYFMVFCFVLYLAGPHIGLLDIRLLPFIQLFLTIMAALLFTSFLNRWKSWELVPVIVMLAVLLWVLPQVTFIKGWIKWNYEGFEQKSSWPLWQQIISHLQETTAGRVVYEHSPTTNIFGSERAFENLSYWARRNTLEGLYMQSSISSPFVFYIQSEISKVCSGPFPQYSYTSLNLANAEKHLQLFNITQYIVRSPEAKGQASQLPWLKKEAQFGEYEIYRLTNNDGHYVVAPQYQPVLFTTKQWKKDFFDWFKDNNLVDIPLVYLANPQLVDEQKIKLQADNLQNLPREKIISPKSDISETLETEALDFHTNLVGYPHLIKISYHPNWQVVGADKIYLVSPSFMLVYPNQPDVRLSFGKSVYNRVGEALSWLGLSILAISAIIWLKNGRKA